MAMIETPPRVPCHWQDHVVASRTGNVVCLVDRVNPDRPHHVVYLDRVDHWEVGNRIAESEIARIPDPYPPPPDVEGG